MNYRPKVCRKGDCEKMQTTIFDFLDDEKMFRLKSNDQVVNSFINFVPYEFQESRPKAVFYKFKKYLILQWEERYFDKKYKRFFVYMADTFNFSHEVDSLDQVI
jgi:hypothetical protein